MKLDDTKTFRQNLNELIQRAFTSVLVKTSGEELYCFAIYCGCNSEGAWLRPLANTQERHERAQKERDESGTDYSEEAYYRWAPHEWFDDWAVDHGFEEFLSLGQPSICVCGDSDGVDNAAGWLFATIVLVLQELDREGFFGIGKEREQITLFCSEWHGCQRWLEEESVRRLNSATVYRRFFDEWITNSVAAEEFEMFRNSPDKGPTYRSFLSHLNAPDGVAWWRSSWTDYCLSSG